jgi:hypothetical protein
MLGNWKFTENASSLGKSRKCLSGGLLFNLVLALECKYGQTKADIHDNRRHGSAAVMLWTIQERITYE